MVSAAMLVLAVLAAAGCKGKGEKFTFRCAMSGMFSSEKRSELVAMAFDDEDPDRRREGITLMSDRKWACEEPYLKGYAIILRNDPDPRVRSAAVRALARSNATGYLEDVIKALGDEAPAVRWDAAVSLDALIPRSENAAGEKSPADAAISPLSRCALEDVSRDVRGSCVRALRHFRDPQTVRTLKGCLRDPDFGVCYRARESLSEIFGKDLGADPKYWPDDPDSIPPASASGENRGSSWWGRLFKRRAKEGSDAPAGESE